MVRNCSLKSPKDPWVQNQDEGVTGWTNDEREDVRDDYCIDGHAF